jgi:hypothetical protein
MEDLLGNELEEKDIKWSKKDYGDLFTIEKFIEHCKCGALIDYDGHGNYATKDLVSNIIVRPSDVKNGTILKKYKYIMWYNK